MAVQVLQWNCRSIFRKLPEFKQFLSTFRTLPDIICLQETHLTPKYQPSLPGYTLLRKDRPPHLGKGGGLCVAVKHSVGLLRSYHCKSRCYGSHGYQIKRLVSFQHLQPSRQYPGSTIFSPAGRIPEINLMRRL